MRSIALCPISNHKINEKVARINAGFTVLLLILFFTTQSIIPIIFLAIDFLFRSIELSRYSIIGITSKSFVSFLSVQGSLINAGPKVFAARIGLVFSSLIIISYFINASISMYFLTATLGLFSFLEFSFGLCVACEIYPFIYRILYKINFQS
jgi:hypothetical protein